MQKNNDQVIIDKWRSVTISDRFMFRLVMEDKEICKETLELLLGIKISEIGYLSPELSIEAKLTSKGIRLDVYIKDVDGNAYDLEMQAADAFKEALGKRTRYYQSIMDSDLLKKGIPYAKLSRSIVLFICKFDPFDLNYPKYSFLNLCQENKGLCLKDESFKIFINTTGNKEGLSAEVISFMEYINTGVPTDAFTDKLENKVKLLRNDDEKAVMYMTYEQEQMEAEARGEARGRAEGEVQKAIAIAEDMLRDGVSSENIQKYTKLSLEQIQEIATKIGVELA